VQCAERGAGVRTGVAAAYRVRKAALHVAEKLWLLVTGCQVKPSEVARVLERGYEGSLCPDGRMACCMPGKLAVIVWESRDWCEHRRASSSSLQATRKLVSRDFSQSIENWGPFVVF